MLRVAGHRRRRPFARRERSRAPRPRAAEGEAADRLLAGVAADGVEPPLGAVDTAEEPPDRLSAAHWERSSRRRSGRVGQDSSQIRELIELADAFSAEFPAAIPHPNLEDGRSEPAEAAQPPRGPSAMEELNTSLWVTTLRSVVKTRAARPVVCAARLQRELGKVAWLLKWDKTSTGKTFVVSLACWQRMLR